jgi:uncharacterized damage-inducible protein DinB
MSDLKSQFEKGFQYSYAINKKQLAVLNTSGHDPEMMRLLSHVILAQVIWLMRLKGEAYQGLDFWKVMSVEELEKMIEEDYKNWKKYLASIADLDVEVSYTNSSGNPYTNKIKDIIFHVINHGSHHRAQISILLRQKGISPPPIDYIFSIREWEGK